MSYDDFCTAIAYAFETDAALFDLTRRVSANHEFAMLNNNWHAVEETLVTDHPKLVHNLSLYLYSIRWLRGRKLNPAVFERAFCS